MASNEMELGNKNEEKTYNFNEENDDHSNLKNYAKGLIDIALLTSNAKQLKILSDMDYIGGFDKYFPMGLICFSILAQVSLIWVLKHTVLSISTCYSKAAWINEKFYFTKEIFREFNSLVIPLDM